MIPGQTVYLTCGIRVEKARFIRFMGGRCLVSSGEGGITVNKSRVFLTEEEANQHLTHHHLPHPISEQLTPDIPVPSSRTYNQSWRYAPISEPGDGWARR